MIDDDIPLELASEIHAQTHHLRHRLWILPIDVKDGNLKHFSHVSGIGAGACFTGAVVNPI
jgi:hypothetical protein